MRCIFFLSYGHMLIEKKVSAAANFMEMAGEFYLTT